jgi:hypothetical protein
MPTVTVLVIVRDTIAQLVREKLDVAPVLPLVVGVVVDHFVKLLASDSF